MNDLSEGLNDLAYFHLPPKQFDNLTKAAEELTEYDHIALSTFNLHHRLDEIGIAPDFKCAMWIKEREYPACDLLGEYATAYVPNLSLFYDTFGVPQNIFREEGAIGPLDTSPHYLVPSVFTASTWERPVSEVFKRVLDRAIRAPEMKHMRRELVDHYRFITVSKRDLMDQTAYVLSRLDPNNFIADDAQVYRRRLRNGEVQGTDQEIENEIGLHMAKVILGLECFTAPYCYLDLKQEMRKQVDATEKLHWVLRVVSHNY